jgi:hypothetical protein
VAVPVAKASTPAAMEAALVRRAWEWHQCWVTGMSRRNGPVGLLERYCRCPHHHYHHQLEVPFAAVVVEDVAAEWVVLQRGSQRAADASDVSTESLVEALVHVRGKLVMAHLVLNAGQSPDVVSVAAILPYVEKHTHAPIPRLKKKLSRFQHP